MSKSAEDGNAKSPAGRKTKATAGTSLGQLDKVFRSYLTEIGMPVSKVADAPGGSTYSFATSVDDPLLMVQIIKRGIPYTLFEEIQKLSLLSGKEWADILNISFRSLQRYKDQKQMFKPIQSEKILELGEIFILGNEVFGNAEKFKLWLDTPNFALGNVIPSTLLSDSYGQELLVNELTRINYGIFA